MASDQMGTLADRSTGRVAELRAQRDEARRQRDELLEAVAIMQTAHSAAAGLPADETYWARAAVYDTAKKI